MARRKQRIPSTAALRVLRKAGIDFDTHLYDYVPRGGTRASSEALGVDEHHVVKTLIMQDPTKAPLVVLMHGDRYVSTNALARHLRVKNIDPCDPDTAQRHSGYKVGGTSPFGLRKRMPIYAERTIADLPRLYINGGARGLLVSLTPDALESVLDDLQWVQTSTALR